ncbi:MAG: nuclear transport factor 2 family protein [Actinomycetes bacterium]
MTPLTTVALTPVEAGRAVDAMGAAFASGEAARVLGHFVDSDDIAYAGSEPGEVAVGRAAVADLLADLFARDERYDWHAAEVYVLPLGARAVVVAETTLRVTPIGDPARTVEHVPYRLSGLLEHDGVGWRWRTCQGAELLSPAEDVRYAPGD